MVDTEGNGRGQSTTYIMENGISPQELQRLDIQDEMYTLSMGGVLVEQVNLPPLRRVLDIGCGTGRWLMEVARVFPAIPELIGIDLSRAIIDWASSQADLLEVGARVHFRKMDALKRLEFANTYFDLINQRFGQSFLRTWEWPPLLTECRRILRPGGILRLCESDALAESTSPAYTRFCKLFVKAYGEAGHLFRPVQFGLIDELPILLEKAGFQNIQIARSVLEYHGGTPQGDRFYQDVKLGLENIGPFLRRWLRQLPDDYPDLRARILQEISQPDFVARVNLVAVWGEK